MLNKDNLKKEQDFWNGFAKEYAEVQEESPFPIAKDVANYLLEENLLPIPLFIDLAAGVGRFISPIAPYTRQYLFVDFSSEMVRIAKEKHSEKNVTYLLKDQSTFLKEIPKSTNSLLFSAMNPTFKNFKSFQEFISYPSSKHLILRMTKDEDSLFSPYEDNENLIFYEKNFLLAENIPFTEKQFSYEVSEEISKEFFTEYFKDEMVETQLEELLLHLFQKKKTTWNVRQVVFSLIIF